MKKLLILIFTACTFFIFSCATDSVPQDINPEALSELLPGDESDTKDSSTENTGNAENEQKSETEDALTEELPEEIQEPEIITIEPSEIEEEDTENLENSENTETNENAEEITQTDLVPPVIEDKETENLPDDIEIENLEDFEEETTKTQDDDITDVTDETNSEITNSDEPVLQNDDYKNQNEDDLISFEEDEESDEAEEEQEEPATIPSRSVTLKTGETLIVVYPGSGWIYLGSTSEYSNLTNKGRKLGSTDTTYTLLAKEAGTQIHHFYKTDNLTNQYIDDYLEVVVLEERGKSSTKITAPSYADTVPAKMPKIETPYTESKNTQKEDTVPQNTSKTSPKTEEETKTSQKTPVQEQKNTPKTQNDDDIEFLEQENEETPHQFSSEDVTQLLEQAHALYDEKKYAEAEKCLAVFFEHASSRRDEALFLQGQIYESESNVKDIKKAIMSYKNLIQNYPSSPYWDKANKRIIYLNRFYFEAR